MENPQGLKVVGYLRVSTSKQDISPHVQEADLIAAATRNGWDLTVYREEASSGSSLRNRPVLLRALRELKGGKYAGMAVSKLDRLSRNVADFARLLETAGRQNWALICLDLGIDTSTITGAAMAQVTCTFAEMERKKIAERTKDGMTKIKATTGKHMGRVSVLPDATVLRIAAERQSGLTLARLAATLNEEGVPTAQGGSWHPSTVRQVLLSARMQALLAAHPDSQEGTWEENRSQWRELR